MKIEGLSINEKYWDEARQGYFDEDGCIWDEAKDVYWCHLWKFCGCGISDDLMGMIRQALEIMQTDPTDSAAWQLKDQRFKDAGMDTYNPLTTFLFYWLHSQDYTTHGGSVMGGGWPTDKGKVLLKDLKLMGF